MNDEENIKDEGVSEPAPEFKKDYLKDDNNKARMRAGRRSSNRNAGKPLDAEAEGAAPEPESPAVSNEAATEDEGGIVAEANKELEAVVEDAPEAVIEEPETAIEKFAEEEAMEPEHSDSGAIEQFAKEEAKEPGHQQVMQPVGEYTPPEGESHDELVDKYHEALAFGDIQQAKELYYQLKEHRYAENVHRTKSTAQAEQEAQAYVDTANALVAEHPELGEDGLPASKVMALSDVYRQEGMSASEALKQAVVDLYPVAPKIEPPAAEMEAPMEPPAAEMEAPMEPPAAEMEAPMEPPAAEMIPPMEDRMANKRKIVTLPSANARKEETAPPKVPTRADAIQLMKEKRGQA